MKIKQLKDLIYLLLHIARIIEEHGGTAETERLYKIAQCLFEDLEFESDPSSSINDVLVKIVNAALYSFLRMKVFEIGQGHIEDEELRTVVNLAVEHLALQYVCKALDG